MKRRKSCERFQIMNTAWNVQYFQTFVWTPKAETLRRYNWITPYSLRKRLSYRKIAASKCMLCFASFVSSCNEGIPLRSTPMHNVLRCCILTTWSHHRLLYYIILCTYQILKKWSSIWFYKIPSLFYIGNL